MTNASEQLSLEVQFIARRSFKEIARRKEGRAARESSGNRQARERQGPHSYRHLANSLSILALRHQIRRQQNSEKRHFHGPQSTGLGEGMTTLPKNSLNPASIGAVDPLTRPHIRRTPIVEIAGGDFGLASVNLIFKLELLQHS